MKTLIMLSAMPGSGKSTWAKAYQEAHPHTLIVSSDAIRYELTGQTQDFSKQKEVWELFSLRQRKETSIVPDQQLEVLIKKWEEPTEEIRKLFNRVEEVHW